MTGLADLLQLDPPQTIPADTIEPLSHALGNQQPLPYFTSKHPGRADVLYLREGDSFVRKPSIGPWKPVDAD